MRMIKMKNLLFLVLALSVSGMANAAGSFSTLEERMSGAEFNKTGLSKLTADELAALNEWLRRHSVATLENAAAQTTSCVGTARSTADMRGFDDRLYENPEGKDPELITSSIVGNFTGWDRKGTLFKLSNGMVWQQSEKDTFYTKQPMKDPDVTIKRGFMGIWRLSLVGDDEKVRVERVE